MNFCSNVIERACLALSITKIQALSTDFHFKNSTHPSSKNSRFNFSNFATISTPYTSHTKILVTNVSSESLFLTTLSLSLSPSLFPSSLRSHITISLCHPKYALIYPLDITLQTHLLLTQTFPLSISANIYSLVSLLFFLILPYYTSDF